jgi:integrase-like protein
MSSNRGRRRRFGAVRQLTSGRWQARYRDPATGLLRPAPYTFTTKTDADLWLTTTEAEIIKGTFLDPSAGKITVAEWGKRWFDSASPHLKRRTVTLYAGLIRLWINPRDGGYELSAVRPIHIKEWLAGLQKAGLSASRTRTAYRVLSQIFASAVDNEGAAFGPLAAAFQRPLDSGVLCLGTTAACRPTGSMATPTTPCMTTTQGSAVWRRLSGCLPARAELVLYGPSRLENRPPTRA